MHTQSTTSTTHRERPPAGVARSAEQRRLARPVAASRARSWTGRATVTFATDSHLSRLVTGGTFRTRVSEMRDAARPADRRSLQGALADAAAPSPRRWFPEQPTTSG